MTIDLTLQQGDERWKAMRRKAQTDLYFLNEVVLGYGNLVPMRPATHRAFCRLLERRTGEPALDDAPVRLFLLPRELGKTTLGTQGYPIQHLLNDPNRSFLLCNEKEANCARFLGSIQKEFESNDLLRALFPELIPQDFNKVKWSATEMEVQRDTRRKEPSVWVTGVGGTVTGMHPDEVICDDIISIEAMRNAKVGARQIIESVNDWIHTLWFLVNKNAPRHGITFIGTHWFHDDCYDHVQDYFRHGEQWREYAIRVPLPDGKHQTLTARRAGDLMVFIRSAIEDGQSIFPEKWDLDQLARMRAADPVLFAANMLNEPSDEMTAEFKESWLKEFQWVGEDRVSFTDPLGKPRVVALNDLDRIIIIDPGGFGAQTHQNRARAAMVLIGSTNDGIRLILRVHSEQDSYLSVARLAVNWGSRYQPRRYIVEQTAQQASFLELLRRDLARAGLPSAVESITPQNRDKDSRILDLEPFFQQGMVYIGAGPEFLEFRAQYSRFPRGARRDLLDALAYGPRVWKKVPLTGQNHADRQARELAMLRDRMGLATPTRW